MNVLASAHSQGIAKGFGMGMAVVLLAYAGLYGWTHTAGPEVRKEIEGKLVSRTVMIDRVLPINPPIQKPLAAAVIPPTPITPVVDEQAVVAPVAPAPEIPAAPIKPDPVAEPVPEPAPVVVEDETLKDIKKYENGMSISPVEGLFEESTEGPLPVLRNDGLSAFKAYRKPFVQTGNKPVISIAISDMGLSAKVTEDAVKSLPPEITLIMSPYAEALEKQTNAARAAGHEVWLTLPMESTTYPKDDPGPHTMLIGAPERENQQKLDWIMSRTIGYTGLVATYQPQFMSAQNDARPVLGSIYKRGVGFVASGSAPGSMPETMALSMNAAYSSIDVWIDKPENTPEIINASLKQLEVIARDNGFAAGIISPSQVSFREIMLWLATLEGKGIVLAPLSAQTGY